MGFLRSVARRARKFARLGATEKWLAVQIIALLMLVRVGLWTLPFRRVRAIAIGLGNRTGRNAAKLSPQQLTSLVSVGAEYVPGATCLTQALVAQLILRRHGYEPILKIGVTRSARAGFEAHAWVESNGEVIIGQVGALEQYTALPGLEPTAVK